MKIFSLKKAFAILCSAVILLAAGCQKTASVSSPDPSTPAPETTVSEPAVSEESTTRTVSTIMGDVEIPTKPERIATFGIVGDLVAMGVMPICGNSEASLFDGLLTEDDYTYLLVDDYEGILAQAPDLIILSYEPEQDAYDKLTAIAPTVVTDALTLTFEERIAFTGEIIGEEEAAAKAMTDFETLAADCRSQLEAAGITGKTITVMEGTYLFGSQYGRGADIMYNYLGFTAPDKLQEVFDDGGMYLEISMEVLGEYCGDYILNSVWDGSEDLSDNAVWNSIPAVKNGHVIEIDFSKYYSRDLYSSAKQVKDLTESLLALD